MAKQTTLRVLLNEFEAAIRKHEHSIYVVMPTYDVTCAKQRIFSYFDQLAGQVEDAARMSSIIRAQNRVLRDSVLASQGLHRMFDLEAAKRGEPIEALSALEWRDCKFIGSRDNDQIVVEFENVIYSASPDELRMKAPVKITVNK